MTDFSRCVVCGSSLWDHEEEWRGFKMVRCRECGLTFTLNPTYKPERYADAYRGEGDLPVPEEHAHVYAAPAVRLSLEAKALLVPPPRLTPAEKRALSWLKRKYVKRGSVVIDCGCGSGRFLRALKRSGFKAVGVDISEELVENLRTAGFEAMVGKAPDFPWDGPHAAITFFEVLEHIPDPVPLLSELHRRFPETVILASVPSPKRASLLLKGQRGLSDYPPNHFLRWTPKALEIAFHKAGYREVDVVLPSPIGSEMVPGLGQLVFKFKKQGRVLVSYVTTQGMSKRATFGSRIKATAALWLLYAYQRIADIVGYPMALQARMKGALAASILVIAKP